MRHVFTSEDLAVELAFNILRNEDPLPVDLETYLLMIGVDVSALRDAATSNIGPFIG